MRAINVCAGVGTLAGAFLKQGADIVWAQEESEIAAEMFRHQFPEISCYIGELTEAVISRIPEFDLLLMNLNPRRRRLPVYRSFDLKQMRYLEEDGKELGWLEQLLVFRRPGAICIELPFSALKTMEEITAVLVRENYFYSYRMMSGDRDGGVPFKGKKIYLTGFLDESHLGKFVFPSPSQELLRISELMERSEKMPASYYHLPQRYETLFTDIKLQEDEIYQVVRRRAQDGNSELIIKMHRTCPVLTERSSRDFFVLDPWGLRRLSPTEYLQLQGNPLDSFLRKMNPKDIWTVTDSAGVYPMERRLAAEVLKALGEPVREVLVRGRQKEAADCLLRGFERFLYKKRIGLLCMPTGTGKAGVLKYVISELIKRTWKKWKIVILSDYSSSREQMVNLLRDIEGSLRVGSQGQELYDFMFDEDHILISSYRSWESFINQYQPVGIHTNLILIGIDPERSWRCLRSTKDFLPQIIYAGIASFADTSAAEVFGPVLHQYTIGQAQADGLLLPVSVEHVKLLTDNAADRLSKLRDTADSVPMPYDADSLFAMVEFIRKDLTAHGGKAIVIADSIQQARELKLGLDKKGASDKEQLFGEKREVYLYVSSLSTADRERQLQEFMESSGGVLLTVNLWLGLSVADVFQIYVPGVKSYETMAQIYSLAARADGSKSCGRVIVFNERTYEEAQGFLNVWEEDELLFRFCDCLKEERYEDARRLLTDMKQSEQGLADRLTRELVFIFGEQTEIDLGRMEQRKLSFMVRLWLCTSKITRRWLKLQAAQTEEGAKTENGSSGMLQAKAAEAENAVSKDTPGAQSLETGTAVYKNSAEKGAALENALLRLLHHLFVWKEDDNPGLEEKTDQIMDVLRKVRGGIQNGRDVELLYTDETGQKRRCYFECKFIQSRTLKQEQILGKLLQVQREAQEEIEHWILVAPHGRLDQYSASLLEEAGKNPGRFYPIKSIQVWNEENQIQDLFGLVPELYHSFFKNRCKTEGMPEDWTESKKQQILQKWKTELAPVVLLPAGLRFYLSHPENIMFDLQNNLQERKKYEELYQEYVRLNYYDENGILSREYLEDEIIRWLSSDGESSGKDNIRVITGEYGDGKTFFLYSLCRRLLKEFGKNPQKQYLPIFISLKNLKTDPSPEKLLERRMKELGCEYSDFQKVKENFHVLLCLDGFDEISSRIDYRTIQQNARLLADCCDYGCGAKIIITSRRQCFEGNYVKDWLYMRLGGYKLVRLAPVKRPDQEAFIFSNMKEADRLEKWGQLNDRGKLRTLMGKPYFLDMMKQLLESEENIGEDSVVSIYERYIRKCLKRKFYLSFDRDDAELFDETQAVERIYAALQTLAYALQKQGKEALFINEFEKYLGKISAEVLWLEKETDEASKEDADNRFSMRTLLTYGENGSVAFSHRSLREYFAAVYLLRAMEQSEDALQIALTESSYNYEILSFFAELIKSGPEKMDARVKRLIALVNVDSKEKEGGKGMSLSAKIMQILYDIDKTIPAASWSGKDLGGVNIPGADLTNQSFIGAKFIKANLNNVILNGCDCSYCDMSGVRLGETSKILDLKFNGKHLLCVYQDGSIRKWDISHLDELSCIEDKTDFDEKFFGEEEDLFAQNDRMIRMSGRQKDEMVTYVRYLKNQGYRLLSVGEDRILISESRVNGEYISLIDLRNFHTEYQWKAEKNSRAAICDKGLVMVYDGGTSIEIYSIAQRRTAARIDIKNRREISALTACESADCIMAAFGCLDGEVCVYRCTDTGSSLAAEGRGAGHGLSSLTFCGLSTLASDNSDGEIHLLRVNENKGRIYMDGENVMRLGIYCKGIQTEGLMPEEIRMRLDNRRNG